jgi:hypothetical protein
LVGENPAIFRLRRDNGETVHALQNPFAFIVAINLLLWLNGYAQGINANAIQKGTEI